MEPNQKRHVRGEQDNMYYRIGDNRKFESAALKILLLKDPRCCKMMFGESYNFSMIYAYALGIASASNDYRILDAIKYRREEGLLRARDTNYIGTDKENIREFFEFFNDSILSEIRRYECKNVLLLRKLDFSREVHAVRSEEDRKKDMDELENLLRNVDGSYKGFVLGIMIQAQYSNKRCRKLIQFIKDNPSASPSDILYYSEDELGFLSDAYVTELETYVDFGIDVDEDNFDSLGKWLCFSVPTTGYGLFSKDTWTSEELLPILEKYV